MAMKRPAWSITRESFDYLVDNIQYIVTHADDYDQMYNELEDLIVGEGFIEEITEEEDK